jgi:hypothetical protein
MTTSTKDDTNPLKPVRHFANEEEEREFWKTHSSTDYVDWSKARRTSFPNLGTNKASQDQLCPTCDCPKLGNVFCSNPFHLAQPTPPAPPIETLFCKHNAVKGLCKKGCK